MLKVSIIMPIFNHAKFVTEAMESVLGQIYDNWELIVVDDCSTDNSLEVVNSLASRFAENQLRVIHLDKNTGRTKAKNYGSTFANGEAILFLDADDKLEPRFLQKAVFKMIEKDACVVVTDMRYFDKEHGIAVADSSDTESNRIPGTSLVRRSIFDSVNGYSEDIEYDDWDLWLKLQKKGAKFFFLHEPLFYYRINENSVSKKQDAQKDKFVRQIQKRHS